MGKSEWSGLRSRVAWCDFGLFSSMAPFLLPFLFSVGGTGADLRHAPLAAVFDIWCSSAACGACVLERIRRPVPFAVAAELPRCISGAVSEIFYGMLLLHLIYMRVAMVPQLFDVLLGCGPYEVWCLLFLDEHTRCSGCCGFSPSPRIC